MKLSRLGIAILLLVGLAALAHFKGSQTQAASTATTTQMNPSDSRP